MTTYTAFGVNGNGADGPSSSLALGSSWAAGTLFKVTESGYQLSGYGQWITNDGSMTSDLTFALWEATGTGTGTPVANSTATITTLTPGTWQYVELATPIVLTAGVTYKAVVCSGSSGCLPWQGNIWNGGAYINGVTNGPLTVFSAGGSGTDPDPYSDYQCTYNVSQSDPTAAYPVSDYQSSNVWLDVQITPVGIQYNTGAAAATTGVTGQAFTIPTTGGLTGTGVMTGDVMLLNFSCFTEDSTQPVISFSGGGSGDSNGWKLIPMTDGSANPKVASSSPIYSYDFAYYRVATAADLGATVTITETGSPNGTTWLGAAMAAYTGANQLNPIDRAGSANGLIANAYVTCPTETARIAGDWAVYLCGGGFNIGATLTGPSGSVQRQFARNSGGTGAAVFDGNGATGLASVGGGNITTSTGNAQFITAFTICLAPAGIYVVQTQTGNGGTTILSDAVTEGNTVFLVPIMYGSTDPTSSNVELGGSAVPGTSLLQHVTDTTDCSHDIWMLPNCPAGQTAVSFTASSGIDSLFIYEVAGLGPNPVPDQAASAYVAGGGTTAIIGAGPTPPTSYAPAFALGAVAAYNGGLGDLPGGWATVTSFDTDHGWSGYQVLDSSGATPGFAFGDTEVGWTAGIVTIQPGSGGGGATVAGQVANVTVAAPYGHPNVATMGAAAGVLVAAVPGLASVSVAGPSVSVLVAALAGTASSSSPAIVNGQAANVAVVAWLGQARGVSRAKGGLFLVHFP